MRLCTFFLFFSIIANAQLSGLYPVGTSTYPTIQSAVDSLILYGVDGAVTFMIDDGVYNEQITIPSISGATEINTITFVPKIHDSTVVSLTNNSTFTLKFDGAKHIRFLWMTIQSASGHAIELAGGAEDIIISNSRIIGQSTTSTDHSKSLIYSGVSIENNFIVQNTRLLNGSYAIDLRGSSSAFETGLIIKYNEFENQSYFCIYAFYQNGALILGNHTSNIPNVIRSVYFENSKGLCIEKNKTEEGSIMLESCFSDASIKSLIRNNFVKSKNASCIVISNCSNLIICNNSTYLHGTVLMRGALYSNNSNTSNVFIRNNIFACFEDGCAIYIHNGEVNSNNNVVYSDGHDIYDNGVYRTFSVWQSFGNELNSINIQPFYFSVTDFHINQEEINNIGIPMTEVTDDIDGQLRNPSTPDIGADEFDWIFIPPEIESFHVSDEIFSGGTFDFGSVTIGINEYEVFKLKNTGGSFLYLTLPMSISEEFTVVVQPDANVAPGDSTSFTVKFSPECMPGLKSDTLIIPNNDPDESDFEIIFTGNSTDETPPYISCPEDVVVSPEEGCVGILPNFISTLDYFDDCDNDPYIYQNPAPGTIITETTPVLISCTDGYGNTTNCTFAVSLDDITPPLVTCPGDDVLYPDENCQATLINYIPYVMATDNCDETLYFEQSPPAGSTINSNTIVTITARDDDWNLGQCSFDVILEDTLNPEIQCPGDTILCEYNDLDYEIIYSDNCVSYLNQTEGLTSGSYYPAGITTNTFVVNDDWGNYSTCSFNVEVLPSPEIDLGEDTIICSDESLVLDAGEGYDSYLWSTSSTNQTVFVDSVSYGLGNHNFYVTVTDNGCYSTDNIAVFIDVCDNLEDYLTEGVRVFPNPVSANETIYFISPYSGETIAELYDRQGKIIMVRPCKQENTRLFSLDLGSTDLASGLYHLRFICGNKNYSRRIVIE